MRKLLLAFVPALLLMALAAPAVAQEHPSKGVSSEGRNVNGFGGEAVPHCHINTIASAHTPFDFVAVFPSHKGHVASGLGEGPFVADTNCDGDPGN